MLPISRTRHVIRRLKPPFRYFAASARLGSTSSQLLWSPGSALFGHPSTAKDPVFDQSSTSLLVYLAMLSRFRWYTIAIRSMPGKPFSSNLDKWPRQLRVMNFFVGAASGPVEAPSGVAALGDPAQAIQRCRAKHAPGVLLWCLSILFVGMVDPARDPNRSLCFWSSARS